MIDCLGHLEGVIRSEYVDKETLLEKFESYDIILAPRDLEFLLLELYKINPSEEKIPYKEILKQFVRKVED